MASVFPPVESEPTLVSQEITERAFAERLGHVRDELMHRMRPVCTEMPQDLFVELVDTMAALQLKYEMRDRAVTPARPRADADSLPSGEASGNSRAAP